MLYFNSSATVDSPEDYQTDVAEDCHGLGVLSVLCTSDSTRALPEQLLLPPLSTLLPTLSYLQTLEPSEETSRLDNGLAFCMMPLSSY